MKLFREIEVQNFFESRLDDLKQEIRSEGKNKLLNMNETKYIAYLVDKYQIESLVFFWNKMHLTEYDKMIPAKLYPRAYFFNEEGKEYSRQIITYHIPFSGNRNLLHCSRSVYGGQIIKAKIHENKISFDIVNWRDNSEEIKRNAEDVISYIKEQANYIKVEVHGFNSNLENKSRQIFQARKAFILKQFKLVESLGVPFIKSENVPFAFSAHVVKKESIIKPFASSGKFTPEYYLDEEVYNNILKMCHDIGIEMERHPSIYADKDENTLRDHFIMILSPNFQSVTGETFNKIGKTDILIRHKNANVFVAECKFWKGIKAFYETIDQILSYLTWRDSKTAILCFVKNKEINPVLGQIESETSKHSCYVKYNEKQGKSWFNYEFHLKDDPSCGIKLAVLCFHFPTL